MVVNQALELGAKVGRALGSGYRTLDKYALAVARSTADMGDTIAKSSRAYGLATDFMQGFREVASQYAGIEGPMATRSLLQISKSALDASRGLSTATEMFKMAGISATDSAGKVRSVRDIVRDLSYNLQHGLIPQEQQAAVASNLLRDRTGRMILALQAGPEALDAVIDRMNRYGAMMSDELLALSEEYIDSPLRRQEAVQGCKNAISEGTLPTMIAVGNVTAELLGKHEDWRAVITDLADRVFPAMARTAIYAFYDVQYMAVKTISGMAELASKAQRKLAVIMQAVGLDRLAARYRAAAQYSGALAASTGKTADNIITERDAVLALFNAELARLKGLSAAQGQASGAEATMTQGEGVAEADIVISKGAIIDLGQTTTEAADTTSLLAEHWQSVASAINSAGSAIRTLTSASSTAEQRLLAVLQMAFQLVGQFGGPLGAGIGGVGSAILGMISGIGDRGMWPEMIADRGSLPNTGLHHTIVKRRDEMVLDPSGTTILHRTMRFADEAMRRMARGGGDLLSRQGGGTMTARIPVVVQIGTREIMREISTELELDARSGRGPFASGALVTG